MASESSSVSFPTLWSALRLFQTIFFFSVWLVLLLLFPIEFGFCINRNGSIAEEVRYFLSWTYNPDNLQDKKLIHDQRFPRFVQFDKNNDLKRRVKHKDRSSISIHCRFQNLLDWISKWFVGSSRIRKFAWDKLLLFIENTSFSHRLKRESGGKRLLHKIKCSKVLRMDLLCYWRSG